MALAAAFATCFPGVTGGTETNVGPEGGGVVVRMSSSSSSVSAGGVAGVTSVAEARAVAACTLRISSTAAHLAHSSCLRYIYCCWGPTTLPGRTIRINAMASLAVKPYFHIR